MSSETIDYKALSDTNVEKLDPLGAEKVIIGLIAQRATIRGGGKILAFSEFNENPDPLVNRLLARMLVSQTVIPAGLPWDKIAVLSIENSAGYLVSELTHEMDSQWKIGRPPRIIRARKSLDGSIPSPAMGEIQSHATVIPITSGGVERHLIASIMAPGDISSVSHLFVVDDFKATGNSLRGGIQLGVDLLRQSGATDEGLTVIPMAAFGKPSQATDEILEIPGVNIAPTLTAVDVHFWGDQESGQAFIQANGFEQMVMQRARAGDFVDVV